MNMLKNTAKKMIKQQNIEAIREAALCNDMALAYKLTMFKVNSNPEKLAHRVGQVVGTLIDNHGKPDLAVMYLNQFNK